SAPARLRPRSPPVARRRAAGLPTARKSVRSILELSTRTSASSHFKRTPHRGVGLRRVSIPHQHSADRHSGELQFGKSKTCTLILFAEIFDRSVCAKLISFRDADVRAKKITEIPTQMIRVSDDMQFVPSDTLSRFH